jgi:hypothetical protein
MSVRLSACIGTDFDQIWYWRRKSVEKHQICLKSDDSTGHFTWSAKYIYVIASITKYCVPRQECKSNAFLRFSGKILRLYCRSTAIQRERIVEFPWQQWLRERVTLLRYTCIVCLVSFVGSNMWWWEATSFRMSQCGRAAWWTSSYFTQSENLPFT